MITKSFWGHGFIWKLNESYETSSSEDTQAQFCLQFQGEPGSTCILKALLPGLQHRFNVFPPLVKNSSRVLSLVSSANSL